MSKASFELPTDFTDRFRKGRTRARLVRAEIKSLSDYFATIEYDVKRHGSEELWYRGHADVSWSLIPAALRPATRANREKALNLLREFKRLAELKLKPPTGDDAELKWVQYAQHYGLPTRLLDWTTNPMAALYFAALEKNSHGAVYAFDPIELNQRNVGAQCDRPLDSQRDLPKITKYLRLTGMASRRGLRTVAIKPTWNSERIVAQHGCFTLHGSRSFFISKDDAPSLCCIPILRGAKASLMRQLNENGSGEMDLFPELEHLCNHLRRNANLSA